MPHVEVGNLRNFDLCTLYLNIFIHLLANRSYFAVVKEFGSLGYPPFLILRGPSRLQRRKLQHIYRTWSPNLKSLLVVYHVIHFAHT
jgi:hypothetical protein